MGEAAEVTWSASASNAAYLRSCYIISYCPSLYTRYGPAAAAAARDHAAARQTRRLILAPRPQWHAFPQPPSQRYRCLPPRATVTLRGAWCVRVPLKLPIQTEMPCDPFPRPTCVGHALGFGWGA